MSCLGIDDKTERDILIKTLKDLYGDYSESDINVDICIKSHLLSVYKPVNNNLETINLNKDLDNCHYFKYLVISIKNSQDLYILFDCIIIKGDSHIDGTLDILIRSKLRIPVKNIFTARDIIETDIIWKNYSKYVKFFIDQ